MARLVIFFEDSFDRVHELDGERTVVGRKLENDLVFDHESISRVHASFMREGGRFVVEDQGATNGVFVNGKVVRRSVLADGDRVDLGAYSFVFRDGPPSEEEEGLASDRGPASTAVAIEADPSLRGDLSLVASVHEQLGRLLPMESTEAFMRDMATLLSERLAGDRLIFVLRDGRSGRDRIVVQKGFPVEALGADSPFLVLLRSVAEGGALHRSTDAEEGLRLAEEENIRQNQLRSLLCMPISVARRRLAIFYVDRPFARGAFSSREGRFLSSFCERAAHCLLASCEQDELRRANRVYRAVNSRLVSLDGVVESIVAEDVRMAQIVQQLRDAARSSSWILLRGEVGVGKEYFARAAHLFSMRCEAPFVRVDCAQPVSDSLEAQFFGRQGEGKNLPGLLEMADGGTLYLHDVHALSPSFQKKLLHALQEGQIEAVGGQRGVDVDCRVIASTPHDLGERVRTHRFREDLQLALSEFRLIIPPLRERKDDVLPLAEHFLRWFGRDCGGRKIRLSGESRERLLAYDWPGNTRELRLVIEWAVMRCPADELRIEDLPSELLT